MDPEDHLRGLVDGIACSVCEEPVDPDRVRLLARRDDLAFLQVECGGCGSTSLGFVDDPEAGDLGDDPSTPPVTADDVLDMHALLRDWGGDLRSLVGTPPRSPEARPAAADRTAGGPPA